MRIMVIASALVILLSNLAFSQTQQFTLNNGLKILVKEDHRAPIAVSMVWYQVGSADEPGGLTGVSHALEHLMFKGTKKYPLGAFSKKIAALGGQENAFTNNDYTAYFEKIAATHLATSFELEADRMQGLLLDANEFSKEIKVIQEERRLRTDDNPQAVTFERFLATAHLSEPYHHPVIGWMNDLQHMTVKDARQWYQQFYAPNNATLVVVGDVTAEQVYHLAQQYFGALGSRQQVQRKVPIEPPAFGIKSVEVDIPAQVPMLLMGYTVPSVKSAAKQDGFEPYALDIITTILDSGDSGRFGKELVHGKQIASSANTYYNLYARYQTQFVIYGTPNKAHTLADLETGFVTEMNRLKTALIDEKELHRIKTQIIAQKTFEKDSIFDQAMELGLLETVGLGWQTAETYIERINNVTPEQIQQTARRYFQQDKLTVARLMPKIKPSHDQKPSRDQKPSHDR